jgi:hypothetical protein
MVLARQTNAVTIGRADSVGRTKNLMEGVGQLLVSPRGRLARGGRDNLTQREIAVSPIQVTVSGQLSEKEVREVMRLETAVILCSRAQECGS